jgi:hypothetical protein
LEPFKPVSNTTTKPVELKKIEENPTIGIPLSEKSKSTYPA